MGPDQMSTSRSGGAKSDEHTHAIVELRRCGHHGSFAAPHLVENHQANGVGSIAAKSFTATGPTPLRSNLSLKEAPMTKPIV